MKQRFAIAAFCLVSSTAVASAQSLATADGRVVLTVTKIDRLAEYHFYSGLGAHTEDQDQIERAGEGREFASLTFSVRWLPGRRARRCTFDGPPPLLDASRYLLIDDAGAGVAGLEASYYNWASNPCREFTVLFRASREGATYTALRFLGREATLGQVAGAYLRWRPGADPP